MDKPALDAVFLAGPSKPKNPGDMGPMADEAEPVDNSSEEETEKALDASIDEMFSTDDPVQRREAFKRAMQLCNQQSY